MNVNIVIFKKIFFIAAGLCAALGAQAAERIYGAEYYRSPVGFAITLAGNVGEIRSDHFHTGIDIKALQGVGSPVYAAAEGYVSRVGVGPTGYGNVLYVTHPNGETSVYGHLDSFVPQIARWVRGQQYAKRSFRVDLYPAKGQFPVAKGERIASLGNSGSSGGPHLHFEIRDSQGRPRNLIAQHVFQVADRVAPVVSRILLYEVDSARGVTFRTLRRSVAVKTLPDGTAMPEDTVLKLGKRGYLAYEMIDYKDGRSNTLGVYGIEQRVDGEVNFSFEIDRLDFATTGYVNTFVDYPENHRARRTSVLRAWVSPHNKLAVYGPERRFADGMILTPAEGVSKRVETVVTDDAGNRTTLKFRVVAGPKTVAEVPAGEPVTWWSGSKFDLPGATVAIPGGALYESMLIPASRDTVCGLPVVRVGTSDIPLQKAATVSVAAPGLAERLRGKALVVTIGDNGKPGSVGGAWDAASQRVEAQVKRLGCFAVAVDTAAPVVTPVYASGARIPAGKPLKWTVTDDLSGIVSYTLTVDGKWELLAWDPKSRSMEHAPVRGTEAVKHNVVLTVGDAKGNVKTWKGTYIW